MMADEKYRLVFSGEVADGADIESVRENIRNLLKIDEARVEKMFGSGSTTLKNDIDHETALKYKAIFDKTGARCSIEHLEAAVAPPIDQPEAKPIAPKPLPRRLDVNLPPEFKAVKDQDEDIYWLDRPNFTAFIITGIPFLMIGLLWGAFDYFGFIRNMKHIPAGFSIPFFALHLFPFWGSILNMVRLFLVHGNTCYAFTNKRLMLRSGFWGTDFKAIDYDRIVELDVDVNPIENMLGVGTIKAFSGSTSSKGTRIYDYFIGIENPYEVFKRIKEVSVDIKTDWNYPNAMRPKMNPGYQTSYSRK
jgi:Bacterial PH domain